jgi:hypothetical protein
MAKKTIDQDKRFDAFAVTAVNNKGETVYADKLGICFVRKYLRDASGAPWGKIIEDVAAADRKKNPRTLNYEGVLYGRQGKKEVEIPVAITVKKVPRQSLSRVRA